MRFCQLAKEFGRRVSELRCERGEGVAEFAIRCHIDVTTMYDIERGSHDLMLYNVLKICRYTHTPIERLLTGLDELVTDAYDGRKGK